MRVISRPSSNQFPSEPRIIIYFEHINTGVRNAGCNRLRHREGPAFGDLVRQASDQVNVDIFDSGLPKATNLFENGGTLV